MHTHTSISKAATYWSISYGKSLNVHPSSLAKRAHTYVHAELKNHLCTSLITSLYYKCFLNSE